MEGSKVINPNREEVSNFEPVLIVCEHCWRELIACDVDLGHDAETFTYVNCRCDHGITNSGPVGGVGPLRYGDRYCRPLEYVVVNIGPVR